MKAIYSLFRKTITTMLACSLLLILLCGCGNVEPIDCPFTDIGWETTEDELISAEGEYLSTYDSTYGGLTYTYEGSYMERTGTIKYMYDEKGVLMSVAWAYSATDDATLLELYNEIHGILEDEYGKSEYNTTEDTNYGDVWKMKEGHIILSVMNTDSNKALQIAYVNPLNEK